MKEVETRVPAGGEDPDAIFALLTRFDVYPQLTTAVRSVVIHDEDDHGSRSTWEVNFREGILRWTERDRFDMPARRIEFTQLQGDLEQFDGCWEVRETDDGCELIFRARFDLGIPTLADLLDPIAEAALRENIELIANGIISAASLRDPIAACS